MPGGGNSSPLSYGILCWGNTTPVNPPTNIDITNNTISNVLGSAISLGTNTASVTISGNNFSNIIPVVYSTTTLAIGVQAELSDGLDINNNTYSDLTHANSLVNCTNTSIGNNTYLNSPLMLNSTHPHSVIFNDVPWWNIIYDATFAGDFYQAYYSDTINASYQGLVQAYAGLGAPIWNSLSSSNPGCDDPAACNYDAQALSDDGSCVYPSNGVDTQVHRDTYTWIDGNTYTASNNTATWTLTNAAGCDSVVTLDLTINNSNAGVDTQVHRDTYTWIDGVTYTSSNNTATWTLTNAAGCDSVVTLDLTINNSNAGVDTQVHCDTYTWIDGVTYTSSNNTATWTLTNAAGCDSVVTLDLTINNSNAGVDTQVHCDTYTWIDGVTYTSSNNTATWTLTNAAGCDSVVTLDLQLIIATLE